MSQVIIWILMSGCQEKGIQVPGGTNSQPSSEDTSNTNSIDCTEQWEHDADGVWHDPVLCGVWSPLSPELTWHQAISSSEATDGGCDQFCDLDTAQNYCADLQLGGFSWKTPTIAQLKDLTTRQPPFANTDYDLWSRTSDPVDELAWTSNIEQPGMDISLYKTSMAYVRCVAE